MDNRKRRSGTQQRRINRDTIRFQDLRNDGGPRLAVCLCLDNSGSMGRRVGGTSKTRLDLLIQAIREFFAALYKDEMSRYTVELSIVTFGDTARVVKKFSRVEHMCLNSDGELVSGGLEWVPQLTINGTSRTVMGEGVNLALDQLERCKQEYSHAGVDYYQPWLVLISDGVNNGSEAEFECARQRVSQLVQAKKLAVYPLAVGTETGMNDLNALSPDEPAIQLEPGQMSILFKWLAKSAEKVSAGALGYTCSPKMKEAFVEPSWARHLLDAQNAKQTW